MLEASGNTFIKMYEEAEVTSLKLEIEALKEEVRGLKEQID